MPEAAPPVSIPELVSMLDADAQRRLFEKKPGYTTIIPAIFPMTMVDIINKTLVDCWDVDALKVHDTDLDERKEGQLLLQDNAIALDAGAAAGAAFDTLGHQYLFVTIVNPTWATNPTALTVVLEVSTDAFDTETFILLGLDGVQIVQTLQFADAIMQAFYMPTQSNAGAVAATNTPLCSPVPTADGMTARLFFTPTGAAITNETMIVNVYGVTPR